MNKSPKFAAEPKGKLTAATNQQEKTMICLAIIAGYVDSYGFFNFKTFLSFMSGNTTQTGFSIGGLQWSYALISFLAIVFFTAGIFPGTLKQMLQLTHLTEETERANTSAGFLKELLADHESIIEFLRGNINAIAADYHDLGTSDFITGLMETHEGMAWMIRAHLK